MEKKSEASFAKYKEFIQRYISVNILEWKIFTSKLSIKKFKKNETILYQGDVCKELYFINSGLVRAYILDESGKDFTWTIYFNDQNSHVTNLFVVDYQSFVEQKPATIYIEALEDTELVCVSFKDVQFLYKNFKKWERFGRMMSEAAYSYLHKQTIERQCKSADERFLVFVQESPHLLEKVPQYHIATLLGITPQHLSRLKKRINIS
ncbi:Crp/Fnr family transcriptional regulator [Sulfurimonas marina]|uniref:Crp/Fnr family transcriptional regulator n=1 Tax=Sulfurimonas marina TaxID=2590551 RepID=A0A7M1AWZ0_9BACT|nr:Crp/Fnr family transcriptional regulator [Sulfurimonas marina]QOP41977.1 Crp/Fnr family transcriptional regulator [Sulfurimonas marina]